MHCKYCRETILTKLLTDYCENKNKGCNFEIVYCNNPTCFATSAQELTNHQISCSHNDNDLQAKANRIGLGHFLSDLKSWETKAKKNLETYIKNFREGIDSARWKIDENNKCCKKCVPGDPPADYLEAPIEKYHLKSTNTYGDEITYNHVCIDDDRLWKCVNCNKKVNEVTKYGDKEVCLPCYRKLEANDNTKTDIKKQLLLSFENLNQYYQQNRIKDIIYNSRYFSDNHDLKLIDYANNIQFATLSELPTEIQPVITSYFVDNNNTSLSQQELSSMINNLQRELENENKPTNYLPW